MTAALAYLIIPLAAEVTPPTPAPLSVSPYRVIPVVAEPPVVHLDAALPPTSSFPSGHTAAAICLYGAVAALVLRHRSPETGEGPTRVPVGLRAPISALRPRAWWRWVVFAAAVVVVVAVAFARLYRGAHHPTDVLASALFAVPWLLLVLRLVGEEPDGRGPWAATRAERAESVGGHR